MVITSVGVQAVGPLTRSADASAYRWNGLDQGHELRDVVAVAAGQGDGEGNASSFGDDVVFRARFGAVDRARAGLGPPLSARTWELSISAAFSAWLRLAGRTDHEERRLTDHASERQQDQAKASEHGVDRR
jgi:hypothetical protein